MLLTARTARTACFFVVVGILTVAAAANAFFSSQQSSRSNRNRHAAFDSITQRNARRPLTQDDYRAKLTNGNNIVSNDVATLPRPGTSAPSSIHFNHDGTWVTYLLPDTGTSLSRRLLATSTTGSADGDTSTSTARELFQPGNKGTENDYSLEEKLRRERARMMGTGVTSYMWSSQSNRMIVPLGGAIWLLDNPLGGETEEESTPLKVAETNTATADDDNGNVDSNDEFDALPKDAPLLDAKISADGSTVAFVAEKEVYVVSIDSGDSGTPPFRCRRVTSSARGVDGRSNGVADYVAQEELERSDGFWLSPKGQRLVYESVDESHIPAYRITHQGENEKGLSDTLKNKNEMSNEDIVAASTVTHEEHRYPFAGACNPKVKLGVVNTLSPVTSTISPLDGSTNNDVVWFDLSTVFGDDFYLAKVEWLACTEEREDSTQLVVQLLDRRQKELALVLLNCENGGTMTTLHVEKAIQGDWVNLNDAFRIIPSSSSIKNNSDTSSLQFLWGSERDGYNHLYVLEANLTDGGRQNTAKNGGARVVRRLTGPGEFVVEEVLAVDEENQCVYYMGTSPNKWLERHLFRAKFGTKEQSSESDNTTPECLTEFIPGQHSCVVHVKAGCFVDTVSSTTKAPVSTICKLQSLVVGEESQPAIISQLHDAGAADPRVAALGDALQPPTFHQFSSTDKKVTLQAALYLPDEATHGKGPWPLVVATYGGPHVQYVQDTWGMMTVDLRSQFLRANGFCVLKVDNRGSMRRGIVFETPIYGNMGDIEVEDQVAGVHWAVEQGYADGQRVAVSGWSYGGYMALKCLTSRPDVFHAGIAGAPVTDWTLYDTAYTERYMGLPQENPDGYRKASALAKVCDLQGSLLLCHGLLDENVLFRHSAVLVNALIEHQKAYELALFPSERHGPRRQQDRAFLEERILAFLQRSLGIE